MARAQLAVRQQLGLDGMESLSRSAARGAAANALHIRRVYLAAEGKPGRDILGEILNAETAENAEKKYPRSSRTLRLTFYLSRLKAGLKINLCVLRGLCVKKR